jgi:hypothetical protein
MRGDGVSERRKFLLLVQNLLGLCENQSQEKKRKLAVDKQ